MKRSLSISFSVALLLAATLCTTAQAAGVQGAIFTTTFDGTVVNANKFSSKCAVYLDGGPGPNAPAQAAGLPDGDYFFQVTDPSGKVLLSSDPVQNRRFQVSGGVIVAYTGTGGSPHPIGLDQDHGATTIGLATSDCPADFLDSPNDGGVYKVWATPISDFQGDSSLVDNDCGKGCFHGFVPSKSKTDNFKVQPVQATFCLTLRKEFSDGDGGFVPYTEGWQMTITDPLNIATTVYTDPTGEKQICGLTQGAYVVTEEILPGTQVVGLIVNGTALDPFDSTYSFTWDPSKPEPVITFQNAPSSPGPG